MDTAEYEGRRPLQRLAVGAKSPLIRTPSKCPDSSPSCSSTPTTDGQGKMGIGARLYPRARRVRFLRNGDLFFKGICFAINSDRYRSLEPLMEELTRSIGDLINLPHGVRTIYRTDGTPVISLDELLDGGCYVACSSDSFKNIDYNKVRQPMWNFSGKNTINSQQDALCSLRMSERIDLEPNDFVHPRIITVIRNGVKPRRVVRMLLNKKTSPSMGQLVHDMTKAVCLDSGIVRRVFAMHNGKQVTTLCDFFGDEHVFIACGNEKVSLDDFYIDDQEYKHISRAGRLNDSPLNRRRFLHERNAGIRNKTAYLVRRRKRPEKASPSEELRSETPTPPDPSPTLVAPPSIDSSQEKSSRTTTVSTTATHPEEQPASVENTPIPSTVSDVVDVGDVIGDGNFAVVYKCVRRGTNEVCALKVIDRNRCAGKEELVNNEISLLQRVQHDHIVELYDVWHIDGSFFLAMEYVPEGDLFDALVIVRCYPERQAASLMYDLCSALQYLHERHIVHRDVKPENLLLYTNTETKRRHLKLADFGLAVEVGEEDNDLSTVCGTPTYVAPEILRESGYGTKVDVWAAGVIAYIMLCGFPPFISMENNQDELFDLILAGVFAYPSPYWEHISSAAKSMISGMLQLEDRYCAEEVLLHPWIVTHMTEEGEEHLVWPSDVQAEQQKRSHSGHSSTLSGVWRRSCEQLSTLDAPQ